MSQHHRPAQRTTTGSAIAASTASQGSQTLLQTIANAETPAATLRLRAEPAAETQSEPASDSSRHIRWSEDVVDNEDMGKKSSKACCIYHAQPNPGESDADSSSSSDDDSDGSADLSRAQPGNATNRGQSGHQKSGKRKERRPSPNAYERQPRRKDKHGS